MNITAVCISRKPERLSISLPFHNLAGDIPWTYKNVEMDPATVQFQYREHWKNRDADATFDYVSYLAHKRNVAMAQALEKYPQTSDVLFIDSYYVGQTAPLIQLVTDYQILSASQKMILGGAAWETTRARFKHLFKNKKGWFDLWGVPELRWAPYHWDPQEDPLAFRFKVPMAGLLRTKHVTGIFIFPVELWKQGRRFSAQPDNHCVELSGFTDGVDLPIYIDMKASFERKLIYPVTKCIRVSLGLGRVLGRNTDTASTQRRIWKSPRETQGLKC